VGGDALESGVQIVFGELPFERCGDLFVVLLEVEQSGSTSSRVWKSLGEMTLRCTTEK